MAGLPLPSAAAMPPHMPKQWVLPNRPASSAASRVICSPLIVVCLGPGGGRVVVEQDGIGGTVEIVELTVTDGPEERPDRQSGQPDAQRDHDEEDFHQQASLMASG